LFRYSPRAPRQRTLFTVFAHAGLFCSPSLFSKNYLFGQLLVIFFFFATSVAIPGRIIFSINSFAPTLVLFVQVAIQFLIIEWACCSLLLGFSFGTGTRLKKFPPSPPPSLWGQSPFGRDLGQALFFLLLFVSYISLSFRAPLSGPTFRASAELVGAHLLSSLPLVDPVPFSLVEPQMVFFTAAVSSQLKATSLLAERAHSYLPPVGPDTTDPIRP